MDKRLDNKLTMVKAVTGLLSQNEALLQGNAPLSAAASELLEIVGEIDATRQATLVNSSGLITEKENLQVSLIEATYEVSSMLYAYAERSGNKILRASVDFPISDLKKLRDGELNVNCKKILELANSNAGALIDYGITEEKRVALANRIAQYEQQLPTHRITVSERKTANDKMKKLIKQASDMVADQLDRLMVRYKTEHPDFYSSYLNARKIVDYGIRHEKGEMVDETAPPINPVN